MNFKVLTRRNSGNHSGEKSIFLKIFFSILLILAMTLTQSQCGTPTPPVRKPKETAQSDSNLTPTAQPTDKAGTTQSTFSFSDTLKNFPVLATEEFAKVEMVSRINETSGILFNGSGKSYVVEDGKTALKETVDLNPKGIAGKVYALPGNHFWNLAPDGLLRSTKPMVPGQELSTAAPTFLAISNFKGQEEGKVLVLGIGENYFITMAGKFVHASFYDASLVSLMQFAWPANLEKETPIAAGIVKGTKKLWIATKGSQIVTASEENKSWTLKKEPFSATGISLSNVISFGICMLQTHTLKTSGVIYALEGNKFKVAQSLDSNAGPAASKSPGSPVASFDFAKAKPLCITCHDTQGSIWTSAATEQGWKDNAAKLIKRVGEEKNMPQGGMSDADRAALVTYLKTLQ